MQWAVLRRAFPWRTGLLMGLLPVMVIALFVAWFRWELPPLEGYYLLPYFESSRRIEAPESNTQIEWLYKAAPGQKSEPVSRQDVDSDGTGVLPIELSSSARERGWTELVNSPTETISSPELERRLREDFYGNQSFRRGIAEPTFEACAIPFVVLFMALMMRRELVSEWRRLYGELYDDAFEFDAHVVWADLRSQFRTWAYLQIAHAKASFPRPKSSQPTQPSRPWNPTTDRKTIGSAQNSELVVQSVESLTARQRRLIFPGATAVRSGNVQPKPWDESQWID